MHWFNDDFFVASSLRGTKWQLYHDFAGILNYKKIQKTKNDINELYCAAVLQRGVSNIKPINQKCIATNMCKMTLIRRNNRPELNFKTNFDFAAQVQWAIIGKIQ